jgi:hypothetical protein
MESSSDYNSDSTNPFLDKEINPNTKLINSNNELINLSDNENDTEINTESSFNLKDYNNKSFKLNDEKSSAYILKEKLFIRTLLPINPEKDREMLVQCTR